MTNFENFRHSRNSLLAIPEHIEYTNIEQDLVTDKRFESIFVPREYIDNETIDLKLFLRGHNQKLAEDRLLENVAASPRGLMKSKFHLFYHHNSFNNNKFLFPEQLDLKSLNYKEEYDRIFASIDKQLRPFKLKLANPT